MSGKLDQSLDQIMTDRKTANPKRGGKARPVRSAVTRAKATIAGPTGGIQKNTKAPKTASRAPAAIAALSGDSKIIVSNLPEDVSETLIKDFFSKAIGHVKKVLLAYGPNGRSRGEATVTFNRPASAVDAQKQYNAVKVDGRPMKIELVGGAAAAAAQATKTLQDRIAKPKNAAKEKTAHVKTNGKASGAGAAKGNPKKKSGRAGKPKAKTAEELDAEMQDYFGGDNTNAAATNVQPTANGPAVAVNGDTGMEDEVM